MKQSSTVSNITVELLVESLGLLYKTADNIYLDESSGKVATFKAILLCNRASNV